MWLYNSKEALRLFLAIVGLKQELEITKPLSAILFSPSSELF